ncbi:MAG: EamA family transporter [Chitinophagaceae bacterium]|nr:EamA family transporter [Chitinophagaceae bacterium]
MNFPDFQRFIIQASEQSLKRIAVLNPLTIHKKGTRTKALFCLALVCFFWGTTWIASKEGVRHMPALQMAGMRQLMGGACFVLFFIYKKEVWPKGWGEWRSILVLSFLNFLLSNSLSTWGVKFISAGLGSIMGAIFPLWLVIIGLFSGGSRMPSKAIAGMLLGFAGVCIVFYEHLKDFRNPEFLFGISISLIATWSWAFGTLYTKKHTATFNPYFSLGLQMVISGFAVVLLSALTGNSVSLAAIPWQSWAAMGYLLVFGSLISFIAYIYALKNLPTEQVSIYAYINPIVAVLLGAAIFSEKLTVFIAVGGLVTLLGVYLVNKAFKAIPPPEQPETEGM